MSKSNESTLLTIFKKFSQKVNKPKWPLDHLWPHVLMTHVRLYPRIIVSNSCGNTSKYVYTVIIFPKKNQKISDPKMTFDSTSVEFTCVTLPKDHCIQVPWKYIKVCGYRDPFFKTKQNKTKQNLEPMIIDP